MAKSIRYKITLIDNVIVFQCIQASRKTTLSILHQDFDKLVISEGTLARTCASSSSAIDLTNAIHAAIHKEFAGGWEPEKHEMVKDSESFTWEYLAKDEKTGVHICIQRIESDSPDAFVRREMVFPMVSVEIPTGPCEVCYGIEGCEDGVQVEPKSNLDYLVDQPVIRLDREVVESTWDASQSFYDEIKRLLISQGVDFDWIGGGE